MTSEEKLKKIIDYIDYSIEATTLNAKGSYGVEGAEYSGACSALKGVKNFIEGLDE